MSAPRRMLLGPEHEPLIRGADEGLQKLQAARAGSLAVAEHRQMTAAWTSALALAHELAEEHGWRGHPIRNKVPLLTEWQIRATTNHDGIDELFHQAPRANQVGIACGEASGLVVMDEDDPAAFAAWATEHGITLPETAVVQTPRPGFHRYYKWAPELRNYVKKIPGLDIRTDGGNAVAVGNPGYRWAPHLDPGSVVIAPFPDVLVPYLNGHRKATAATPEATTVDDEVVTEGARNDTLARLAGAMRRVGTAEGVILAALRAKNETFAPPLDDSEVEKVAASITRYPPAPVPPEVGGLWRPLGIDAVTVEPQPREWLLRHKGGAGMLPMGRAGLLAAEGGIGKTHVLLALAISVVTGRAWLNHFCPGEKAVGGSVALLLREEDFDEVHPRTWAIAEALQLTPAERALCAERIIAVPLAGFQTALTNQKDGVLVETPMLEQIRQRLAAGGPWALVVLDPLSRFAGGEVEVSNESGTRFMQAVESLCRAPGGPTVLTAAHSSKQARRSGGADVRGVSGLSDAARWVATLRRDGATILFEQTKSNYSCSMSEPLRLKWVDGTLRAVSQTEVEEVKRRQQADQHVQQQAELDADVALVVATLGREGGLTSKAAIARCAGIRNQRAIAALDLAIARGRVVPVGNARRPTYTVVEKPVEGGVSPPIPPGNAGTRPPGEPGTRSAYPGNEVGTAGNAGTTYSDNPLDEEKL